MSKRWAGLALVLSLIAAPLEAQSRGLELGADVGAGLMFADGSTLFSLTTPTSIRVGIPVGEKMAVEPRFLLSLVSGEGETVSSIDLTPAIMLALGPDPRQGLYVALLPQLRYASAFGESASQFGAGAGVGVRIRKSERFGFRVEGQFLHNFENDDFFGSNDVNALLGFSFFTR